MQWDMHNVDNYTCCKLLFGHCLIVFCSCNASHMTEKQIKEQIDAIRQATAIASQSKESARQFLIDAGIIMPDRKSDQKKKK